MLVLSLFPGIDLLGRGFEAVGFCVVRGPDLIFGGDIRDFHPPAGKFDGVIGGPPCQEFSKLNRKRDSSRGGVMLAEFCRVVDVTRPSWFICENVPTVPDLVVEGYGVQRFDLDARECGSSQSRPRHFQFGHYKGFSIAPVRDSPRCDSAARCVLASEARRGGRREWPAICELQGLPSDFSLPSFTKEGAYRAVGNGVHVEVARRIAMAIFGIGRGGRLCLCGCGREVTGRSVLATAACRKREERRRKLCPSGSQQLVFEL